MPGLTASLSFGFAKKELALVISFVVWDEFDLRIRSKANLQTLGAICAAALTGTPDVGRIKFFFSRRDRKARCKNSAKI
jgi:hypothetical protein